MITHFIIMSSSYSKGTRIAIDYIFDEVKSDELRELLEKIVVECGEDVSISTHSIQTDSKSWKSVTEKDHFFKDVKLIDKPNQFIRLIKKDRVLDGLDIAKYILCKVKCTHLKLEKLVYYCYAEYLCKYGKELYKGKIYAYKYGPVVESVYAKYKRYGYKEIEQEDEKISREASLEMPSRSRILFAEDAIEKIKSIDETIEKYGKLSAGELVALTHKKDTPWYLSGEGKIKGREIYNDIIKKYHANETI